MGVVIGGLIAAIWTVLLLGGAAFTWLRVLGKPVSIRTTPEAAGGDKSLITYPTDYIFAVFDTRDAANAAAEQVKRLGAAVGDTLMLTGDAGASRLDASGEQHGLLGRIIRMAQATTMDSDHVVRYEDEARRGHCVLAVHIVDNSQRTAVEEAMQRNGGYFMNWYGRFHFESIPGGAS